MIGTMSLRLVERREPVEAARSEVPRSIPQNYTEDVTELVTALEGLLPFASASASRMGNARQLVRKYQEILSKPEVSK